MYIIYSMLVESRQREKPTYLFEATGELSDRHVCRGPDKRVEADSVEGWPCHAMALECLECLWSWWSCMITGAWIPQRNVQTFKGLPKSAMYSMCLFEKFSCVEKPPVMGLHRMRYTENMLIELLRMLLELLGRQVLSLSNLCPIYDCLTISILFPCGFSVLRDLDVSYLMINDVINRLCCRT